jgi:hypothetical protein
MKYCPYSSHGPLKCTEADFSFEIDFKTSHVHSFRLSPENVEMRDENNIILLNNILLIHFR